MKDCVQWNSVSSLKFLTHCILVDFSTLCWTSPLFILGVFSWVYFVAFILFVIENPVSKL